MKLFRIVNYFPNIMQYKYYSLIFYKAFKKTFNYLILFSERKGMEIETNNLNKNQENKDKDETSGFISL